MKIIDLDERHLPLYFNCLEDLSDEMKEAGNHDSQSSGAPSNRVRSIALGHGAIER